MKHAWSKREKEKNKHIKSPVSVETRDIFVGINSASEEALKHDIAGLGAAMGMAFPLIQLPKKPWNTGAVLNPEGAVVSINSASAEALKASIGTPATLN